MATMKDVARLADVGVGTVSRVINKNGTVKEKTRKKVEAAIEELNYEPNNYARGLKLNRTNTAALILPTIWHPYFAEFAYYVETELEKNNYKCLLCNSESSSEKELEYIKMLQQNKVDGIIAITYSDIDNYVNSSLPFVSIDRHFEDDTIHVTGDNIQAGRIAAEELIKRGCTHVAYIGGVNKFPNETTKRGEGFINYANEKGIKGTTLNMPEPIQSFEEQIKKLFDENPTIDGVFTVNDFMALDVIDVLEKRGVSIPENVQVIGCDGIKLERGREVLLSTVRQPIEEMASHSVKHLLKMINKETVPERTVLPMKFIQGKTTNSY